MPPPVGLRAGAQLFSDNQINTIDNYDEDTAYDDATENDDEERQQADSWLSWLASWWFVQRPSSLHDDRSHSNEFNSEKSSSKFSLSVSSSCYQNAVDIDITSMKDNENENVERENSPKHHTIFTEDCRRRQEPQTITAIDIVNLDTTQASNQQRQHQMAAAQVQRHGVPSLVSSSLPPPPPSSSSFNIACQQQVQQPFNPILRAHPTFTFDSSNIASNAQSDAAGARFAGTNPTGSPNKNNNTRNQAGKAAPTKQKKKRKHSFDSLFSLNSEFDEFEGQSVRFKPESIDNLVQLTKFDKRELKLMYRGFKQLCPSGVVKEDKFKLIYAQFFPRGADTNQYARFVFNTFDVQNKQEITFTDFVIGLSVLTRGTIEDKLRWIFTLYDINGDGVITKDELFKVVSSIYDLLGKSSANLTSTVQQQQQQQQQRHSSHSWFGGLHHLSYHSHHHHHHNVPSQTSKHRSGSHVDTAAPTGQDLQGQGLDGSSNPTAGAREQTERLLRKFDLNQDGVITLDEFLESCHQDDNITKSISVFNTIL